MNHCLNLKRRVCLGVFLIILGVVPGCSKPGTKPDAGSARSPYTIVTTVGMVGDITSQVVGERGSVAHLIGEGVDPHLYKPTVSDVKAILAADIVVYSGLMLEGKMGDTLVKVARSGKPVYAVTESIDPAYLLSPPEMHGHSDPHVWMDVQGWMKGVDFLGRTMGEVDSAHAAFYRSNADAYMEELRKLDEYARTVIKTIPESRRVLITAHDAFNYFGRAYGLEVLGIQGISTESEAGLEDINRLVDTIVQRGIRAIFNESSVSEKNVRALVEGARSRGAEISIAGPLYSDAMGKAGTYEGTYIGMIDHNVTLITRALGGQAPEKGLQGKLSGVAHETGE
ncbi:MAG: zinc ABC transporter substrate-binding protein [Verrucomicrobia bacterium]|nr:zinc ABC transporter substrate-binding protein [Verrucomicrobiota bacterium]